MEINNVDQIRKSARELMDSNRRTVRDEVFDSGRSVEKSRFTKEDITAVANKLKTKTPISVEELKILKNALLDNDNNIKIVLSIHGALRGIVRELSGTDIQKQTEAAGCCCNLALGDTKSGMVVTKAAGTYLVTCVDSLSYELAVNCIWALGNLAGSGSKVAEVLIAQGAWGKLLHTLDGSTNQCVQDAIVYALTHFIVQMKDDLSQESLQKLITTLSKLDSKIQKWHLLYLTSCHHEFITSITDCDQLITNLIIFLPVSIQHHFNCKNKVACCDLIFVVRTLANIASESDFSDSILNLFVENNLISDFRKVISLNNELVNVNVYWLLGNLMNCSSNSVSKNDFFNKLVT